MAYPGNPVDLCAIRNRTQITQISRINQDIYMALRVLYEDNHLIAVYKPAGVLVQGDETGDPTLMDEVKYYLKTKYNKLGKVFLGLVHRLDRPVSGVIVFAKTSKGASRLSEQIRKHEVEKIYHALVMGKPKQEKATLVHYLRKNDKTNKVDIFDKPTKDALEAELSYETVQSNGKQSIVKIRLKTGRPHQIRAQMSAIGCPIVGDVKYGGPSYALRASEGKADSDHHALALCATSFTFTTATGGERKMVEIEIPKEWSK